MVFYHIYWGYWGLKIKYYNFIRHSVPKVLGAWDSKITDVNSRPTKLLIPAKMPKPQRASPHARKYVGIQMVYGRAIKNTHNYLSPGPVYN